MAPSCAASELALAIEALQRLTAREPEMVMGWACLARLYLLNQSFELCELHTPLDKAISYACQGVALDPAGARSRCLLAAGLLAKGELPAAREVLEPTLRSNPDSLAYREMVGWALALCGDWPRGMALIHDAMHRNPYCLPHARHGLWADRLRRGEFEAAYSAALEYQDSSAFWRELMTACCLGHLGKQEEARAAIEELLLSKPDFQQRGRILIGYYIKSADLLERVFEGLRKAGLALD
jgi:adenylate cyclase